MEKIHRSKVAAKKLWSLVRLAFFLLKKGLISHRKLILDLNKVFKRIRFSARYHHHAAHRLAFRRRRHGDYEFSCSNSPDPVFSRVTSRLRKHHARLCSPLVLREYESSSLVKEDDECAFEFGAGSSDCLSEEEGGPRVDDEAEEFIRRFYEQLRSQTTPHLLQY